jgi:hypothetical protein
MNSQLARPRNLYAEYFVNVTNSALTHSSLKFPRKRLSLSRNVKVTLACALLAVILLAQAQLIGGSSAPISRVEKMQTNDDNFSPTVINVDGDLNASITDEQRDIIWRGKYPEEPDWFSGDAGQSKISLGYNFTDSAKPIAQCDIDFFNAYGNRPFPFMSSLNDAFPKLYLNQTRNIVVHFDIKLQEFACDRRSWLRTSVVVALQNEADSKRIFFEQDIQDSPSAKAALPLVGGDVAERCYTNINSDTWVHLDVPFGEFMQSQSHAQFAQPFFSDLNGTFVESVYLVNECFGNGYVSYSIANWWVTAEKTSA